MIGIYILFSKLLKSHLVLNTIYLKTGHCNGLSSNGFGGSLEDLNKMMGNNASGLLARKSQNMTECVPVPTSEHVAEIVGRQGKNHIYFE